MERPPIFTVGYGNRTTEDLIALLQLHAVKFLLDVRSQPYSGFKPEFSREPLQERLRREEIQYVFLGEQLGGRPEEEACYTDGQVDYVKCREQPSFCAGIARLQAAWEQQHYVALMCSEGKPQECHRSKLIGAALDDAGIDVRHLDENGLLLTQQEVMHRLTGGQGSLFGPPEETVTARKRRRPSRE